uniref:RILP-like protein 2 isoform X2 n=1 Tax=Halichoerus grypus TaxID=9711 RepID=UPI001658F5D1|nr:RILP-like protein 2 isoform X2 [Halichoerus grypus]
METRQRWRLSPRAGLRRPPLPHPVCNTPSRGPSRSPLNLSVPLLGCPPFLLSSRAPNHILGAYLLHGPQRGQCTPRPGLEAPERSFLPRAHPSAALIGRSWAIPPPRPGQAGSLPRGKFSAPGGSWKFGEPEKAAPAAAGVWVAMEEPPLREEEEEEEEEGDEAGPEGALSKSPFQLTAEDVYDISYVMGRELMALGSDPRVTQLQFKIVRVLEMLETLVNEGNLTVEELRMERDNLRKEVEGLRTEGSAAGGQVNLGPDKMVVDLTDPNRPRFTLQELRDVLQERNKLKSQLLVVQEELQCYKSGLIPPREGPGGRREKDTLVAKTSKTGSNKEEKTIIRKLFSFRSEKQM